MRSLLPALALALASVAAFTAVGCAAPEESEDVDSAAGAAVGSMPERTTLFGAGGLLAYFDGGWEKPNVTLYRGNAKQTLRCEAQPFRLDGNSDPYSAHGARTSLRCFDTPVGSTAAEFCQVIFTRKIILGYVDQAEYSDDFEASCWNGDRTTAKQKAFLKFVLGDVQTTTIPNKERTEPTAEQTYARGVQLQVKNTGKDVDNDPYIFAWTLTSAIREAAKNTGLTAIDVAAPGASLALSARDREYKPIKAKPVVIVEGGKVVAYPEMIKRIRAGFGIK